MDDASWVQLPRPAGPAAGPWLAADVPGNVEGLFAGELRVDAAAAAADSRPHSNPETADALRTLLVQLCSAVGPDVARALLSVPSAPAALAARLDCVKDPAGYAEDDATPGWVAVEGGRARMALETVAAHDAQGLARAPGVLSALAQALAGGGPAAARSAAVLLAIGRGGGQQAVLDCPEAVQALRTCLDAADGAAAPTACALLQVLARGSARAADSLMHVRGLEEAVARLAQGAGEGAEAAAACLAVFARRARGLDVQPTAEPTQAVFVAAAATAAAAALRVRAPETSLVRCGAGVALLSVVAALVWRMMRTKVTVA